MPYKLKDQSGKFLKIIEYPNNCYAVVTTDEMGGCEPTLYKDGRDVLNGVRIIEMVNENRAEELNEIIKSGVSVTSEVTDRLHQIEVTQVEV